MSDPLDGRRVERRTIYEGHVLDLAIDTVEFQDGARREREIVVHPGAVAIVALDGDELVFVRQYRAPAETVLLEIPAGTRDRLDDGSVEAPEVTAVRELAEETGLRAATWRHLARFWTAPGFATEAMDLYLATDLEADEEAETPEEEQIELERVPWQRALALVESGEIADAKSIVGVLWLARLRELAEARS